MILNFSNMGKFPVLPDADYPVKVIESTQGSSKRQSQPKWHMRLQVLEGPFKGQNVFLEHSLMEQALPFVARSIKALTGEDISSETAEFEFNPENYLGREAVAVVKIDDSYDGTPRNKVERLLPMSVVARS